MEKMLFSKLEHVSLSLFRKNIIGIHYGSVSARVELNKFLINKKEAIFDNLQESDFILLYHSKDYRWKEASMDSEIHSQIYKLISDAKFILYSLPPYAMSYALNHDKIVPVDYFGHKELGTVVVYDPKSFDDWYDRAEVEISRYFQETNSNIMVIRGYGVYAHARDLNHLVKMMDIVENSCKILLLSQINNMCKKKDIASLASLAF